MENRHDLKTILPFLPIVLRSSSLCWPSQVVQALKSISKGPDHSKIDSGEVLFVAISDIRSFLNLSPHRIAPSTLDGYTIFFDDFMSRAESVNWFSNVLPALANLLLRLPSLLETHYIDSDSLSINGKKPCFRMLEPQEAGIVLLSQELIAALLVCSLFCLFSTNNRSSKNLPIINFDHMFASLYHNYGENVEHKIRCIVHYFERIHLYMPVGNVSFERKVLPFEHSPFQLCYPEADFWGESCVPLCRFVVHNSGLIEDELSGGLEVDFANEYLGGGALHRGCVQEEIRFMINPELIIGMLFMPAMSDNEAIEIVGAERFSNYTGYGSSFRFSGDYVDSTEVDSFIRRKTRIVAIDALCSPKRRQYEFESLLRETNKAFCGFYDPSKNQQYHTLFQAQLDEDVRCSNTFLRNEQNQDIHEGELAGNSFQKGVPCVGNSDDVGIVTGNWGCGAFGGDPEVKTAIQWLAASQSLRPFISYYTFSLEALHALDRVTQWIASHEWTVGDLWNMLVEYSSQKYRGETKLGFLAWLVPSTLDADTIMHNISHTP